MKKSKRAARNLQEAPAETVRASVKTAVPSQGLETWHVLLGLAVAALVVFEAYQPALGGPFLFDDRYLPFMNPEQQRLPLMGWLRGVRPALMLSFWLNYRANGVEPYWYHAANLLLHLGAGVCVFLIARRFLDWLNVDRWRRDIIAAFAGGLFLLHPLQTEAVSYVASRSENLSVFLAYGAFALFLYRKQQSISIPTSIAVLLLFGAAVTTKEHSAVLPILLLLTDYYWNPGFTFEGIKRNWRLYLPLAAGGAAGMVFVWRTLSAADTAGFAVKGLPWYEYFYTQCRAIWIYIRMFLLPFGQNIDHDYPIARSLLDPGALLGFIGLLALIGAALWLRKEYKLISYGILVFLLLLAPTSSFVPIKDALVERRVYLPSIGLLLVLADLLRRWKASRAQLAGAAAAILLVAAVLTYNRNQVWSSTTALWADSIEKAPKNWRAHFQLAYAYYESQRCSEAVDQFAKAAALDQSDVRLFVDWGLAHDCAGQPAEALAKLQKAATMERSALVYSQIGMLYGKQGKRDEALEALAIAEKLQPTFAPLYIQRGNVYLTSGEPARAAAEFRRAIELDPSLDVARRALEMAEQRMKQQAPTR